MSEWQPIETAPTDGTRILVYAPYSKLNAHDPRDIVIWVPNPPETRLSDLGYWHISPGYCYWESEVTHWAPILKPPAVSKRPLTFLQTLAKKRHLSLFDPPQ